MTTSCKWDVRVDFDTLWRCVKRVLKPRSVFLTTASEPFASLLRMSNLDWYKYDWVWEKTNGGGFLNANRSPLKRHEVILVFADGLAAYNPQFEIGEPYRATRGAAGLTIFDQTVAGWNTENDGFRYPTTILKFPSQTGIHPTQKPVALYEYLIRTYTQPGDVVLDPFCGSGTTGLAALRTGRHYILGDSDPGYVEAARKRIQNSDPYQDVEVADGITQLSLFDAP